MAELEGGRRNLRPDVGQITKGIFLASRPLLRVGEVPQKLPFTRLSRPLQQFLSEAASIDGVLGVGFTRIHKARIRVDIITKDAIWSETGERCAEAEARLADRLGLQELPDLHIRAKAGFGSVAQVRRDGIDMLQYYSEGKREDPDKGMVIEFGNFI